MHTHHAIDYIEFTVADLGAAKAFYASAFGWAFTDYGPGYAGIQGSEAGREVGGMREAPTAAPADSGSGSGAGVLAILYSDDLDASLAAVRAAGGTIVTEPFEFPGGRRFHFADPSGNELAVWSSR